MYLVASAPASDAGGIFAIEADGTNFMAPTENISWLAQNPIQNQIVYSVATSNTGGQLRVWRLEADRHVLTRGSELQLSASPCHATIAPDGSALYTANYHASSVSKISLDGLGNPIGRVMEMRFTGSGPETERQDGAHPHHVLIDDDGRLVVTDLGADILRFLDPHTLEETGSVRLPPGSGPRHTTILKGRPGRWAVSGELSSTVMVVQDDLYIADCRSTSREPMLSEGSGKLERRNYPSDLIDVGNSKIVVANRGAHSLALVDVGEGGPQIVQEWSSEGDWPLALDRAGEEVVVVARDSGLAAIFELKNDGAQLLRYLDIPSPTAVLTIDS